MRRREGGREGVRRREEGSEEKGGSKGVRRREGGRW